MTQTRRRSVGVLATPLVFACSLHARADNIADTYRTQITPILKQFCFDCHGGEQKEGGVSFEGFTDELSLRTRGELWRKVREALSFGNMPPNSETQPMPKERERLIGWITEQIETPNPGNPLFLDPGPTILRQLSRVEYKRTVQDL